ncbi:hypothetical protein [Elioraea rosea]|uniref:hypothetical protein n=1 Tax=Elioraea rosea TaxID=2492390 RepID=UPI0011838229|nr:hypothetical protein [Elioraea rosea]
MLRARRQLWYRASFGQGRVGQLCQVQRLTASSSLLSPRLRDQPLAAPAIASRIVLITRRYP